MSMENKDTQLRILLHGIAQVLPKESLEKKLTSQKPLVIKLGADPTAPDLHLGHVVVLLKMKEFQDFGHNVVFLIGDFTALIGDPTGKSKTRPALSALEIAHNTKTYFEQVSRILNPEKLTIKFNSEWLGSLASNEWVRLCAQTTLARLTEREDFAQRISTHTPISFHELLYPLMQAYDSVALHADVELGGTDQTFNLLMGRDIQQHYNQEPQVIITVPILEGTDGINKMSKSLGNYIALNDTPENAYGKLMSLSDSLIWRYKMLLLGATDKSIEQEQHAIKDGSLHPMALKKNMAYAIVERFWSVADAQKGQTFFEARFQKKEYTFEPSIITIQKEYTSIKIIALLQQLHAISSANEGKRLIQEGAVKIDEIKIDDIHAIITLKTEMIIRVGKHKVYKIIIAE